MKNKLVKILFVVLLVGVLVGCFVFSSSASYELSEEVINSSPFYYSNTVARPGLTHFYYINDSLLSYNGVRDIQFVSNGIKFSRITSGGGNIYFSNDVLNLKICDNGVFIDDGAWRYITIYTSSSTHVSYVRNYFDFVNPATTSITSWENYSFDFTFVNFSIFKNAQYLTSLCSVISSGSITFGVNIRVSLNGSNVESRSFNQVMICGSSHSTYPNSIVFENTTSGDLLSFDLFNETSYLNWSNLVLYAMPSGVDGFYFINLMTLISDQAIGDFPCSPYDDRELNNTWEYYDLCDIDFSKIEPLIGNFYSSYGLPIDGSPLKSDNGLCINSRGILCSDNFPNNATTPWFDTFNIIPDGKCIPCSSSFYWLFGYLTFESLSADKSRNSGESFTFISSTSPENLNMFYNSFGFYYGYCGFVVNGVKYNYFSYNSLEDTLRFYSDVNADTGDLGFPDYEISVSDFVLHSCVLPAGDYVGKSFYQFVVLNMNRVGADISADIQTAYEEGKRVGYAEGLKYGETQYSKYETLGYNKGFEAAKAIYGDDNGGIIGKLLSAPGDAFDSLILYESEGLTVSLWDVFTTLLCASLFVWFLKMFAGG